MDGERSPGKTDLRIGYVRRDADVHCAHDGAEVDGVRFERFQPVDAALRPAHAQHGRIELAVNLPLAFLQRPDAIADLAQQMPEHPVFEGIVVELTSADVVGNLPLACEIASQLRFHNIGVSIDDLGGVVSAI